MYRDGMIERWLGVSMGSTASGSLGPLDQQCFTISCQSRTPTLEVNREVGSRFQE